MPSEFVSRGKGSAAMANELIAAKEITAMKPIRLHCLIPKGSKLLAPGRCGSSAPGVSCSNEPYDPEGVAENPGVLAATPPGSRITSGTDTPGALLRSDPGLTALIPSG